MSHHQSYKLLFSHPEMVVDLLQGFVNEPWIAHCDFSTLDKVSGSYVSDDLRDREDDLIWRILPISLKSSMHQGLLSQFGTL